MCFIFLGKDPSYSSVFLCLSRVPGVKTAHGKQDSFNLFKEGKKTKSFISVSGGVGGGDSGLQRLRLMCQGYHIMERNLSKAPG